MVCKLTVSCLPSQAHCFVPEEVNFPMLGRSRHCSVLHTVLLSKSTTNLLSSSFSSSSPRSNFISNNFSNSKSLTRISQTNAKSPSDDSDVTSICSLLSNSTGKFRNLDNLLKGFKGKLNSHLILSILTNYRHLGRLNTLEFFSWAGLQMSFRLDDSVVEYMADFLCRRKLFDDLKCLLKTVSLTKGEVSSRTISICIRFLGRQGRVADALSLFQEMESEFKCKPDNLVYNNMLYVLCKKENSDELVDVALSIFRRIESPDVYSYSNIIIGLCKFGRLVIALQLFDEMGRSGLVPTRSAVNILIGELCGLSTSKGCCIEKVKVTNFRRPFTILVPNAGLKGGAILAATHVFWSMNDLSVLPSAFIINKFIAELCRLRKIEEAVDVLKVVEDRNLRCLDESSTIVIRALCEVRRVNEACQLFGKMVSLGLEPKLVVYNCIISLLCKLGRMDEADRIFQVMNKRRCAPDNVTYTALIHGYGGARNWEAAYQLLTEMLRMGWCPHFQTYKLVDTLLKDDGRVDLSSKLERKLEVQLLHKYCKSGRIEAAYEKLRSMHERGFVLPIYIRGSVERAFKKAGKWQMASKLLEKMDRVTVEPEEVKLV